MPGDLVSNLIFWGTNVLAVRRNKSYVPKVVLDAVSVTISNHSTNSESDILIFTVPNAPTSGVLDLTAASELIQLNQSSAELAVLQCKTNWADNAQIPMLWDLIYNSSGRNKVPNVSVGRNGVNPDTFKRFSYGFVTVPTQKKPHRANSLAVLRVKSLTGGNYWGHASAPSIASCINEYFLRNFPAAFPGGVHAHITRQIETDSEYFKRFREITF